MASKSADVLYARVIFFIFTTLVVSSFIGYRLAILTIKKHDEFVLTARRQYVQSNALLSGRGMIYSTDARNGENTILSQNRNTHYVYANTRELVSTPKDIEILAKILGLDEQILSQDLKEESSYVILIRDITDEQKQLVNDLRIEGIYVASEIQRYYPYGNMAAHTLGFVGFDGYNRVGQYGIESSYDEVLNGSYTTQRALGNKTYSSIARLFGVEKQTNLGEKASQGYRDGDDIFLTLDSTIQQYIEVVLNELKDKWSAKSGTIIVQEPDTGALLAIASYPKYNPNSYSEYNLDLFINPATQQIYEPGSTFKTITMASAIDSGSVTPETTYEDRGSREIDGYTVSNFDKVARGKQTMWDVLQKSLNMGIIFVQERMGDDKFLNYVESFGFGQTTGIDLRGEVIGNISNLYDKRKVNYATASFGQGIAVTSLQMVNAYSAIANGGKLMRPFIVDKIVHTDGIVTETEPEIIDSPITDFSASRIKSMLASVVSEKYTYARVNGYDIAAKTGTAQIPNPKGGYIEDQVIHNIVGFAPAFSPRFVVLIKLERPIGAKYAQTTLTPVFAEINRFLLNYFNIPPQAN